MASAFPSLEGKCEVLEKLHEGRMGSIYKVRHRLLDEVRVIKVMRPQHQSDDRLRARFLREAQMAVKLRHQNIAQMYDFAFDDAGHGFIVMEYVEGISLQELLARVGAPPLTLSLEPARQALTALRPAPRQAKQSRDAAAAAVEAEADTLARKGEPNAGLAKLRALQRIWPDRTSIEARVAEIRSAKETDQRFAAALAAAAAEEERRQEKGLEALGQVRPEFHGNKTVEFYAVAVDCAGHTSGLAGRDQPLRLKKP